MTELEIKFCLDAAAARRWRSTLQAQGAQARRLQAVYFDTDDGALAQARMALRLRDEDGQWVQTLKAEGSSPIHRLEHEVPVPAARRTAVPAIAMARHDGTPAGDALHAVLGARGDGALQPRHETDVTRLVLHVRTAGGTEAELALDDGEVRAGGRREPLAELEVEHLGGPLAGLFDIAQDIAATGGAWLSTLSKAERGERLRAGPEGLPSAVKARPVELPSRADADAAQLLHAVLRNVLAQVLPNASLVAEGSVDAEHIHQLRVGLRRLRTALRELGTLSAALQPAWDAPLHEAFTQLGVQRDNETVAEAVQPLLQAAGAPQARWTLPPPADIAAAVRSPALQQVLLQVLRLTLSEPEAGAAGPLDPAPLKHLLVQRLQALHRQVLRDGKRFHQLPPDRQHRVRKRAKRLRYLAEFVRPLWRGKAVGRYVDTLKPVQDALGAHNDTAVAAQKFRDDAVHSPDALFAAGFLQAHLDRTSRDAHKALRRFGERAEPFWH
jgi:inorganic triphosphatase YgiF